MAEAEERHAVRWEARLQELGAAPPVLKNDFRRRLNRWWNRAAGAEVAIRRMEAAEDRDKERYQAQRAGELGGSEEEKEFLRQTALEEKAHSRILNTMSAAPPSLGPKGLLDTILKRERWHGRGGGWVADAIYGVNDGLGAVFGIVSGVAGATNNQQHYILIAGLAGMMASSLSMGAGAYLANKSEREIYEAEIAREKAEVEENPEEEIEEMSLFYQLQGFSPEEVATHGGAARRATRADGSGDGTKRARLIPTPFSQPMDLRFFRRALDRDRRFHSDHSVLFHERISGGDRGFCHQHRGALRSRRGQIAHHHPLLVGLRLGNDGRGRDRGGRHLWPRTGFRRAWIGIR